MKSQPKRIAILGATGSIGDNTLQVVRANPGLVEITAIAAGKNWQKLASIAQEFQVAHVALADKDAVRAAASSGLFPENTRFYGGLEGLSEMVCSDDVDMVVSAIVGTAGLSPTLAAIEAGKDIALASKEILVLAGKFVMAAASKRGVRLIPVDSEHSAIFQCIRSERVTDIRSLILTASGGRFRERQISELCSVTPEEACNHPNWKMGPKITVDSATMANKALEVIEARWLFGVVPQKINVVIHPQSIVHSMVEFVDGSILAQLSPPSMTFAIQYALFYPQRAIGFQESLDFSQLLRLDFMPPELERYPCFRIGKECLVAGGVAPAIFNAANEVAVSAFLKNQIRFTDIAEVVTSTLSKMSNEEPSDLEEVLAVDAEARAIAAESLSAIA